MSDIRDFPPRVVVPEGSDPLAEVPQNSVAPSSEGPFLNLVAHVLEVKNNKETLFSLQTHFARLEKYRKQFLKPGLSTEPSSPK